MCANKCGQPKETRQLSLNPDTWQHGVNVAPLSTAQRLMIWHSMEAQFLENLKKKLENLKNGTWENQYRFRPEKRNGWMERRVDPLNSRVGKTVRRNGPKYKQRQFPLHTSCSQLYNVFIGKTTTLIGQEMRMPPMRGALNLRQTVDLFSYFAYHEGCVTGILKNLFQLGQEARMGEMF